MLSVIPSAAAAAATTVAASPQTSAPLSAQPEILATAALSGTPECSLAISTRETPRNNGARCLR